MCDEESAYSTFENVYNLCKKKKKSQDSENRATAAAMIGQLQRGKLNFKEAIDWYSRALECLDKKPASAAGGLDPATLRADKDLCQKLQQESKCWPVDLFKLTGDKARFNGRRGKIFPKTANVILMSTGEAITGYTRDNYGYVQNFTGQNELPPDLLFTLPAAQQDNSKLATSGGGVSEETERLEREILKKLRAQHPEESAKTLHSIFSKQHPDMSISLARIKNILKQLESESNGDGSDVDSMLESVDPAVLKQKAIDQIVKRFMQIFSCPSCKADLYPHGQSVVAPICGHTLCLTW